MSDENQKSPGQPSKYREEFCAQLLEHMEKGLSFEAFGGVVRVHKSTLYEWVEKHPEFKEAKDVGTSLSQLHWEKLGVENVLNESSKDSEGASFSRSLNSATWIFNMKNRFQWRDKQPDEADSVNIHLTLAERIAKARARTKDGK